MKKRVLVLFMVLSLLFSLTACGNSGSSNTGSNDATPTKAADSTDAASSEVDIWAPFDNTVTLSTVTSEYASAVYPEGDDITNNVWIRAYKDKFNVEVTTKWVSDEYDTKINLDIAAQEIPDVFHVNAAQLQQLVDADMVMDLTEVFDTYASDLLKGYMNADYDSYQSGVIDGKFYGIPQMHWGIIDQPDYVWIRKDWKEACGLEDPQSMDDLVNIMNTFMSTYGGYGIAVDQTLDYLNLLAIAWGAHPDMWLEAEDGSCVYGSVQPEMKNALAEWADWYANGIINPDFATLDFAAMNEAVVSGAVGVQPFYQWWGYNPGVDTVSNLGADAIFEPYMIPSATDETVMNSIFFANSSYIVVSKDCENPEALIKLLNFYGYMVDESTGVEDAATISAFTDNDMAHVVGAFRVLNPECDYKQYQEVSAALQSGDTSNFTTSGMWQKYNNSVEFLTNQTPSCTGDYMQQGNEKCSYGLATYVLDNNLYIKSKLWGATPETLLNYGSTLDDILTEGFTKIIMGVEGIDYFDEVVANWQAAGGDAATQAMTEMYGSQK